MMSHSDRRLESFVYCIFLSLLLAFPAVAQISSIPDSMSQTGLGGINSIVGTVFGPTGRPIESRVRVQLSSMTSGGRTTTTNENGSFAFRGLPAGTYTISVEKEKEYEPTSHSVDIITFRGSDEPPSFVHRRALQPCSTLSSPRQTYRDWRAPDPESSAPQPNRP